MNLQEGETDEVENYLLAVQEKIAILLVGYRCLQSGQERAANLVRKLLQERKKG